MDLKNVIILEDKDDQETIKDGLNLVILMYKDMVEDQKGRYGKSYAEPIAKYRIRKAEKLLKQLEEIPELPLV